MIDPAFWSGRRVLVTGHTGFKGSWLTIWLGLLGARVTGLALAPAAPGLYLDAHVEGGCRSRLVDLADAAAVRRVVREADPEVVFHLAAQALVRTSYREAASTWATNVTGTIHLLEALRESDAVRSVVVVTSDKCYEQRDPVGHRFVEADPLGGHDPYSSSKAAAEIAVASWRRSFFDAKGVGVATARAGNVIGGGDWAVDRLLPDLVRSALDGSVVVIRSPHATRPWQHVLDATAGYLDLAAKLHGRPDAFAGAWNFGPDEATGVPVAEVAAAFVKKLDRNARFRIEPSTAIHEAPSLALDPDKAWRELGWRTALPVAQAIAFAADAYRVAIDRGDQRAAVVDQIAQHARLGRELVEAA